MTGGRAVTPARACAYAVLRRVFEEDAYADRALHAEAARRGLAGRERALATQLAYGAVQRRATLDALVGRLARRAPDRLEPPVLAALRLGLLQLVFLDRVPAHAAVTEAVELAKGDAPRAAGLVNAVLRRAAAEGRTLAAALPDDTPAAAALCHSYPEWLVALWWDLLGPDETRALLAAGNRTPEAALRANTLKTTAEALAAALPVPTRPAPGLPEGLIVEAPFDAFGDPGWAAGTFMPQSRAAMAVARMLDPQPGERVLDLCAAPGAKSTHLAALMAGEGEIVAVERHPGRAEALRRTAARMGAGAISVRTQDAAAFADDRPFDRVLVDPPCTDLGTLASRPDARWRKQPGDPARLAALQASILAAGARALRPGGTLVYSTCTISPIENETQVQDFLTAHRDFALERAPVVEKTWEHPAVPGLVQTLPHRDRTDGFFIARLRRDGA